MGHREKYIWTSMWVWAASTIYGFYTFDDPDLHFISIKNMFFLLGGVFLLSPVIGLGFTWLLGLYMEVFKKGLSESEDVLRTGRYLKYIEMVIVFFLTIFCFRKVFDV